MKTADVSELPLFHMNVPQSDRYKHHMCKACEGESEVLERLNSSRKLR